MSDIPRKSLTKREHVDKLLEQGGRCPLCKKKLLAGEPRTEEHMPVTRATLVALKDPNPDDPKHIAIVHTICARTKTYGTKAHLKIDGDLSKNARDKRLSIKRLPKDEVEQRVGYDPGFRLKKKMDGSVVRVRTR